MKKKWFWSFVFFFLAVVLPRKVKADGIIIPLPPVCDPNPCLPISSPMSQLQIKYHYVDVAIMDQIAITHVDQVFYNPNNWEIEGTYLFPIPKGATVTDFKLWIDGESIQGKVLDAQEARRTYEAIVQEMKDPALLEYADQGAYQVKIFPIPPLGERRIELEYSEVIPSEKGLVQYTYPLNTEKFSIQPLEEVRIHMEISSSSTIRASYSPSHPVEVIEKGSHGLVVSYEEMNVKPDLDFSLYYSIGEDKAFHLLSYQDPGEKDVTQGFFTLLLAPNPDPSVNPVPKDILMVVDRSGSMEGEKFLQVQEALRFILKHLSDEDRFNMISFSTDVDIFAPSMQPATELDEALSWVNRLSAAGSTDINRALMEAMALKDLERPTYFIFLTDGLPTQGVVEPVEILKNLQRAARENLRLFAFGVGYDVDTFLLDSLAENHHGSSTYVLPGEPINEIVSGFYTRISKPVLTNLRLDFGEIEVFDVYPSPLPDLFDGSQIIVVGRYHKGGTTTVTLSGDINQVRQTFKFPDQVFSSTYLSDDGNKEYLHYIPRLWATRKIGYLLNLIRLEGPNQEIIDQIVKLSIRYGIVTPYTSYLVTEPLPLGADEQGRIAEEQFNEMQASQDAPTYGREAVEKAAEQGELENSDLAYPQQADQKSTMRVVGSHTFIYSEGKWIDTAFDPESMETVKVSFLSSDYFALAESRPNLAAAFALGTKVIVVSEGRAYEVVGENVSVDKVAIPEVLESEGSQDPSSNMPSQKMETFIPSEEMVFPTQTPGVESDPVSKTDTSKPLISIPCLSGLFPFMFFLGMLGFVSGLFRDVGQ